MPGDPRQCRVYAMRCAELAGTAKTRELKATLLELSKNWERLAIELERTQRLLDDEGGELGSTGRRPSASPPDIGSHGRKPPSRSCCQTNPRPRHKPGLSAAGFGI